MTAQVEWARHRRIYESHAYADLSPGLKGVVEPIERCVRYPHGDVIRDEDAPRCPRCQRTVERMEAAR